MSRINIVSEENWWGWLYILAFVIGQGEGRGVGDTLLQYL